MSPALAVAAQSAFAGGSEMAGRVRGLDWASTPVGPINTWPQSLRTSVSICLECAFPIVLWWGRDLTVFYNDEYVPLMGSAKHPTALGQPGNAVWPEIWDYCWQQYGQDLAINEIKGIDNNQNAEYIAPF
jgi:hypothetical protein